MSTQGPGPLVDKRHAAEVAAHVRRSLPHYVKDWKGERRTEKGPDEALIRIFSRFCELIIDRLNRAPEKNFLAFLDFLGASPLAPQPARVPLTFYLAQKARGAVVPARTQVAAKPAPDEKEPVVFETEQELQVTSATLDSLFVRDFVRDTYTDSSLMLSRPVPSPDQPSVETEPPPLPVFRGNKPIPHILYLALKLPPRCPALKELRLTFAIEGATPPPAASGSVLWEAIQGVIAAPPSDASKGIVAEDERFKISALQPSSDGTSGLSRSGDVVFENFAPPEETEVNGVKGRWIRCRLLLPAGVPAGPPAPQPVEQGPTVKLVRINSKIESANLHFDGAFANAVPLDLSKEFFPFGVRPRLGDTLYLASHEGFSSANAAITIQFQLLNSAAGPPQPLIPAARPRSLRLVWEFWGNDQWVALGTSESEPAARVPDEATKFSDNTKALSETGEVSFTLPGAPQCTSLNGKNNYWVRVRIAGGDYGEEARWEQDPNRGYVAVPATIAPPILTAATLRYILESDSLPEAVLSYEDFRYIPAGGEGLRFFAPSEPKSSALYLGFKPLTHESLASTPLNVYFSLVSSAGGKAPSFPSPLSPKAVTWEYWSQKRRNWTAFAVHDDTNGFRGSGVIPFLAPPDFRASSEFGRDRYWLRALKADKIDFEPELRSARLNTTMAAQAVSVADEILGSSSGKPDQTFRTTHAPVLEGQVLEVLNPTMPSVETAKLIRTEEGEDAILSSLHPVSKREEIWVRWHVVPNFYASGPLSCHYVLNRLTGEVKFGDGEHGRIPPAMTGNIRMKRYRSGGGTRGNKAAGWVSQLRTTVPYVERAVNIEPANGGADAETVSALLHRAPRGVRHGRRAVTVEDFEDMAMLASPAVGRARCVPLRNLIADPAGERRVPGVISLIVVPRSTDPKPLPSLELCDRVRGFLDEHRLPTSELVLVAADYVGIRVKAELAVDNPNAASDVEHEANRRLCKFLHPLSGGIGSGWDFGRLPADSDLYPLLGGIPGVSHVRRVETVRIPDRPGAESTSRFLIYSKDGHEVTVTLEE